MSNSNLFTKEELDALREYLNLTLPAFRENVDECNEDTIEHDKHGALYERVSTLSLKLDSL